jgi:hypothetical protein
VSDELVHEAEVVDAPQPVLRGRFSVYVVEPGNKLVFACRLEGQEKDQHMTVPPMMVKLLSRQLGVSVPDLLARLREGA